jgi:N-acyl-D-aspartate/D-glutamate deacylase
MPTTLLTHWCRDRKGQKLGLPQAVHMLSARTADHMGFADRGRLAPGPRADINIIDFDNLNLPPPQIVHDLPAGGRRLLQAAHGYIATLVAGELVLADGRVTDARPGRLIRATRQH